MIPSTWFRRLLLALFILEVAGALMWLAARLVPAEEDRAFAQTVAGVVFLLGFYAGGPLSAQFLAPHPSRNRALQERLARVVRELPWSRPVFLYEHKDQDASTVGIVAGQAKVYVTTGMLEGVSDEGLKGLLAHEETHVREHHILLLFVYAASYAFAAHISDSHVVILVGFLGFMALRRYLEYRADAGASERVGKSVAIQALRELHRMYPTKRWSRWFTFAGPYPTLPMRIAALETNRRPLF